MERLRAGTRKKTRPRVDDSRQRASDLQGQFNAARGHSCRVEPILGYVARRGLHCKRLNPTEHLLLPGASDAGAQDRFYNHLKKYSFRLFLRDLIKNKNRFNLGHLNRYCSRKTAAAYLEVLGEHGLLEDLGSGDFRLSLPAVYSFGDTLEWFVAQVLIREFFAAGGWGLSLEGTPHGGDYDVLAIAENRAIYVEVKSSPPKQVDLGEVRAFLDRIEDLGPDLAVFLEDTQLRMEDKILPLFSEALSERPNRKRGKEKPNRLPGGDVFTWGNGLFVTNAEPDLTGNLGICLRHFFSRRIQ